MTTPTVNEIRLSLFVKYPQFMTSDILALARINDFIQDSLDELLNYEDFFGSSFKKSLVLLALHNLSSAPTNIDNSQFLSGAISKKVEGDIAVTYKIKDTNRNIVFADHSSTFYGEKFDELCKQKMNDLGPAIFTV